jgi:hypothetical protein
MYWSPVRLPFMVTISSLQSWKIHPKPLLSLHRKGQLAGYSLYFCVSKPSSDRRLRRQRVTSDPDDRALQRLLRRIPFATSPILKQHWLPNWHLSTRTGSNRLKSAGLKSRRVIKRPLLADRHRRTRLAWCLARRGWNLRTWRKIYWSDESRFLLHVTSCS